MRKASLLLAALVLLAAPAGAQAYQFTFTTPIPHQQQVQRALSFQLNRQVAKHWTINPVSFTASGGIPIVIVPDARIPCDNEAANGCHVWDGQHITIYVQQDTWDQEADSVSHEMIETEIDPHNDLYANGRLVEACDPVSGGLPGKNQVNGEYKLMHTSVEDFTYPSYWYGGGRARHYDREWMLGGPARWAPTAMARSVSSSVAPAVTSWSASAVI